MTQRIEIKLTDEERARWGPTASAADVLLDRLERVAVRVSHLEGTVRMQRDGLDGLERKRDGDHAEIEALKRHARDVDNARREGVIDTVSKFEDGKNELAQRLAAAIAVNERIERERAEARSQCDALRSDLEGMARERDKLVHRIALIAAALGLEANAPHGRIIDRAGELHAASKRDVVADPNNASELRAELDASRAEVADLLDVIAGLHLDVIAGLQRDPF